MTVRERERRKNEIRKKDWLEEENVDLGCLKVVAKKVRQERIGRIKFEKEKNWKRKRKEWKRKKEMEWKGRKGTRIVWHFLTFWKQESNQEKKCWTAVETIELVKLSFSLFNFLSLFFLLLSLQFFLFLFLSIFIAIHKTTLQTKTNSCWMTTIFLFPVSSLYHPIPFFLFLSFFLPLERYRLVKLDK